MCRDGLFEEAAGISVGADDELLQGAKCLLRICLSGDERPHAIESCVLTIDESGPVRSKISLIEGAEGVTKEVVGSGIHRIACPGNTICRLASAPEVDG